MPTAAAHTQPFATQESARWLRGAECAAERLAAAASVIVVGDRERDIYEVFAAKPPRIAFIIRATHDRRLTTGRGLFEIMDGFDVLGGARVAVASKGVGDAGRIARVLIKAGGVEPLRWRLATTLPVATLTEASEIVRLYRLR